MARAVYSPRLEIEPTRHLEMLGAAAGLFDTTLAGLRHGSEDLGLATETDPRVHEGIAGVSQVWEEIAPPPGASLPIRA